MAKRPKLSSSSSRKPSKILRNLGLLLALLIIGAAAVAGVILFETEKPLAEFRSDITYLGAGSEVIFEVRDRKSGLKDITLAIVQDGKSHELHSEKNVRIRWFYGAGPERVERTVATDVKKIGLKDGEAELVITVSDFSLNNMFMGNETTTRLPVLVDTRPPRITLQHTQRYMRPGGSGIVVYDLSEPAEVHGARVNDRFFPGFPMRDRENRFIAYIALAWDAQGVQGSAVIAVDKAGNEGKAVFPVVLKNVSLKEDQIRVGDGFLNNKIPEFEQYYPEISGSMLEKYIFVNNEVRARNASTIEQISSNPEPQQLWQDRFARMAGQTMAGYAEQRSYLYDGEQVDRQVHLGIDIASTANAEIRAANRGKVIFADYLGIYGYTVILDHGQGVASLYSHLSRIEANPGDMVDQGTVIAYSGATGMAGGDHLHFSILINGLFVTPLEWWDQHWIDVNINDIVDQL